MGLTGGTHMGLLAQEAETVLPEVVHSTVWPEVRDSSGNVVHPELPVKGIDYVSLVPLLIAAVQEQQAVIAQLQTQIGQCCGTQLNGMAPEGSGTRGVEARGEASLQDQRLLVVPNPVAELTSLEYDVPQAGQVSLRVSTMDGKPLGTLREEMAEPGSYRYTWNTAKLAAGTYLCTYLLDGKMVVQRAVKVTQ